MIVPAEVGENLLPRRYQEEIFARAQEGNIIAALDTGSGKTFISTLLMKWIASRHASDKKIVFLVPKVALVEQQADFIGKQTPLRVTRFHGAMSIELTDRGKWKTEFEATDVLVMTAQIFLNVITHSHWSMEKISLMIFDECHHCRKNHAYNGIMREYFQAQPGLRPKIFGMTASPIWNPKDAAESLATLEKNMNAKVIAVREHAEELAEHLPKPTELIVTYGPPNSDYATYPGITIFEKLRKITLPPEWGIPWDKIEARYEVTKHSLGLFGAEFYLYTELRYRIIQLFTSADDATKLNMDVMLIAYSTPDFDSMMAPEFVPPSVEILHLDALLAKYTPLFADISDTTLTTIDVQLEWCTPQVQVLAKELARRHTPSFQGIVFVEQRHVALALAKLLPRLSILKKKIRCAELVGHGASAATKAKIKGMALQNQQDVVKQFRDGELNLLVATSVAEEGLDFPACDVVIRFDPIQHMVGYVQSRGRARHKTSTFIVMAQEGQQETLSRYTAFVETEPQLKQFYQQQAATQPKVDEVLEEGELENDDDRDLADRERYTVESTKATLTYHSAIGLLGHLCSLIPRDKFTAAQVPIYTGDFEVTLTLPSSLPLPTQYLRWKGPGRHSKKEAKRAVAFLAVKTLHQIGVFDDYLLPVKSSRDADAEDAEGRRVIDWGYIPDLMGVHVRDPWTVDEKLWMHVVYIDNRPVAGLVTGTQLSHADTQLDLDTTHIQIGAARRMVLEYDTSQREILQTYTRIGVWWSVTGRGTKLPLACYLVPLASSLKPDWENMEQVVASPIGSPDWSGIGEDRYHQLLCMNYKEYGRPLMLRRIRHDLSPLSTPPPGSREEGYETYHAYWTAAYTRKGVPPEISTEGPLIEMHVVSRQMSGGYELYPSEQPREPQEATVTNGFLVPMDLARWINLSMDMWAVFKILPRLLHRATDVYRARCARTELALPPLETNLLVEAHTLPNVAAKHSNQRLETLGDSILKFGIVVHLFNRFPHRHEGQLDVIRRGSVSNKTLLSRACDIDLSRFISSETETMRNWRYVLPEETKWKEEPRAMRYVPRSLPRNSMQDCMESTLGAAFVAGGIDTALRTATALGLALGGPIPWSLRYGRNPESGTRSALFHELQEGHLQYQFHREELLLEALTHPSFKTDVTSSYQRLEFLGDALIDVVVMDYLYRKFPKANSGQLSWARSRAVCGPALAYVAVRKLKLHKLILVNNVELSMAISRYVPLLEELSDNEIINRGWKHDPPKALSDVLESVLGAILVDSAWNYDIAASVTQYVLEDILEVLTPNLPKDPVSELMTWVAKAGCKHIRFQKSYSSNETRRVDGISVIVHDVVVAGPLGGSNLNLAKGLVSERARLELGQPEGKMSLAELCDCRKTTAAAKLTTKSNGLKRAHEDEETKKEAKIKLNGNIAVHVNGKVDAGSVKANGRVNGDGAAKMNGMVNGTKAVGTQVAMKDVPADDETVEGFAALAKAALDATAAGNIDHEVNDEDMTMDEDNPESPGLE